MNIEIIGDIPKTSISDVKKVPMDVFKASGELKTGVCIFNRDKVAGVMIIQEEHESMQKLIEKLEEKALYARAENRVNRVNRKSKLIQEKS